MTIFQKARIIEMRLENVSFQVIAQQLGIAKSTVIKFCSGRQLKPICRFCGKELPEQRARKKRVFCNDMCKNKWWFENVAEKKTEKKKCAYCGKVFFNYKHKSQSYCCRACYLNSCMKGKADNE